MFLQQVFQSEFPTKKRLICNCSLGTMALSAILVDSAWVRDFQRDAVKKVKKQSLEDPKDKANRRAGEKEDR